MTPQPQNNPSDSTRRDRAVAAIATVLIAVCVLLLLLTAGTAYGLRLILPNCFLKVNT